MATFSTSAQQAWEQAVRVRAHSNRLREQLACVADQVAEVEEECAAIHDAMAAHAAPAHRRPVRPDPAHPRGATHATDAAPTQLNPASLLAFSEVSCRFLREVLSGQHNDLLRRRVS
jgi:hypothetical protein